MITQSIEHLQVSVPKFGELVGVDEQTVYKWKNGEMGTTLKRLGDIQQRLIELRVPEKIIFPEMRPRLKGIPGVRDLADQRVKEEPHYKEPTRDDLQFQQLLKRVQDLEPTERERFFRLVKIFFEQADRGPAPREGGKGRGKKSD